MIKNLIRCAACKQVIPNYEGHELTQAKGLPEVDWSDADLISAKEFLHTHSGHPLEELFVEGDTCISEKPSYEPMRVTYFYARNAEGRFLIQRTRTALNQPAFYEIVPGRLNISNVSLKIQENGIRKQIDFERGFSPLLKGRMERFIRVFREEIARISPEKIEEDVEEICGGEDSSLAYGVLKNSRWARILNRCRLYFDESELKVIKRFIEENRNPPDVLSIQIHLRLSVIPLLEAESALAFQERNNTGVAEQSESRAIAERKAANKDL